MKFVSQMENVIHLKFCFLCSRKHFKILNWENSLKQAGAELCQAQVKLNLVVLSYDFIWTRKYGKIVLAKKIVDILFGMKTFSKLEDDLITLDGRLLKIIWKLFWAELNYCNQY